MADKHQRHSTPLLGCLGCGFLQGCGGVEVDGDREMFGCFGACRCQIPSSCNWTCPKGNLRQFWQRFREVGGWPPSPLHLSHSTFDLDLPKYLPLIHNGSARSDYLDEAVVALPTFQILKGLRNGGYGSRIDDAYSLRQHFRLVREARVLLISVAKDPKLERFWRDRLGEQTARSLSALGVDAITIPNFSYFTDVPRIHSIWNRARICRIAEEFLAGGLNPIVHIQGRSPNDWEFWYRALLDHPNIKYVAREFQTGGSKIEIGIAGIRGLRKLQDRLGRKLHLVAIAGSRYAAEISDTFEDFTIVDSTPFIKTHKRQRLTQRLFGRPKWERTHTSKSTAVDQLLASNVSQFRQWIELRCKGINENSTGLGDAIAQQQSFQFLRSLIDSHT